MRIFYNNDEFSINIPTIDDASGIVGTNNNDCDIVGGYTICSYYSCSQLTCDSSRGLTIDDVISKTSNI